MAETLAESYKRWRNRIDCGKTLIEHQEKDWKKFEEAYEGEILEESESDFKGQLSQTNLFYVDVRSSIPKLYSQNPYIFIEPETPEADLKAEVLEKVINSKLDDWHLEDRIIALIKGTKFKGRAYIKVSYKFKKDKIGREFVGDEPNDEVTLNFVDRSDLIIPKDSKDVSSARWVAHRIRAPIRDIREKFNLKKDDKPTCEQDKYAEDKNLSSDEAEDFQYGHYYEIENREDHTLAIIVEGVSRWVEKPYEHPYEFYTMFVPLEWNDIPTSCDTKADLHFWFDKLKELCESETRQHNHSRKLNAKYKFISPGEPDQSQVNDIETYQDSTVVHLKPGQDVIPFEHATLGQEVYLRAQALRQDITIISGMNEMKQGLPQTQKTAREAMAIVAEAQDVMSFRASRVEKAIKEVIEKCIWLIQNRYDTTRIISLSGMEEAEFLGFRDKLKQDGASSQLMGTSKRPFLSFVGTDLQGKMRVKIKPGSTRPVNEEQRKADITQLIDLMGKSQQMAAAVDPNELLKEIGKLLHIENKRILLDTSTPEQENGLLKRDIPVLPSINENHDQHIAAHEMENNNTPAFLMHLFAHRLMKSFLEKSQFYGQVNQPSLPAGPGGLSQQRISGLPMGASVPPSAMPQQPSAPNPGAQVQTNQLPV